MPEHTHVELLRINEELQERLLHWMPKTGNYPTPIAGICLHRRDTAEQAEKCVNKPFVAVIVQGGKRSLLGAEEYRYHAQHCMVCGVDMPGVHYAIGVSPEHPFLSVSMDLDKYAISKLAAEIPFPSRAVAESHTAISLQPVELPVLDAFLRLVKLMDSPEQIPVLAPLIRQEIHYRLLLGTQGKTLRMLNTPGSQSNHIAQAILWLRDNYTQALQVESLAQQAHMSISNFHRHFRKVTTLTPLQYQKQLRLHEAQRLMLVEGTDVTRACMDVGYESPTQFNREYKRLFGDSPRRSVARLQQS